MKINKILKESSEDKYEDLKRTMQLTRDAYRELSDCVSSLSYYAEHDFPDYGNLFNVASMDLDEFGDELLSDISDLENKIEGKSDEI